MTNKIITGERLQELCDVYLGLPDDFHYNPRIARQSNKCFDLNKLTEKWNNPKVIFCYAHQLLLFLDKQHYLQNPFYLISHNSDENITAKYLQIIPSVLFYSQKLLQSASPPS